MTTRYAIEAVNLSDGRRSATTRIDSSNGNSGLRFGHRFKDGTLLVSRDDGRRLFLERRRQGGPTTVLMQVPDLGRRFVFAQPYAILVSTASSQISVIQYETGRRVQVDVPDVSDAATFKGRLFLVADGDLYSLSGREPKLFRRIGDAYGVKATSSNLWVLAGDLRGAPGDVHTRVMPIFGRGKEATMPGRVLSAVSTSEGELFGSMTTCSDQGQAPRSQLTLLASDGTTRVLRGREIDDPVSMVDLGDATVAVANARCGFTDQANIAVVETKSMTTRGVVTIGGEEPRTLIPLP